MLKQPEIHEENQKRKEIPQVVPNSSPPQDVLKKSPSSLNLAQISPQTPSSPKVVQK